MITTSTPMIPSMIIPYRGLKNSHASPMVKRLPIPAAKKAKIQQAKATPKERKLPTKGIHLNSSMMGLKNKPIPKNISRKPTTLNTTVEVWLFSSSFLKISSFEIGSSYTHSMVSSKAALNNDRMQPP